MYIYNGILLSYKKKENLSTTWTELENIMLSELNQTEKDILYNVTYMQMLKNSKNKEKKMNAWIQRTGWWFPKAGVGGMGEMDEGHQKIQIQL